MIDNLKFEHLHLKFLSTYKRYIFNILTLFICFEANFDFKYTLRG